MKDPTGGLLLECDISERDHWSRPLRRDACLRPEAGSRHAEFARIWTRPVTRLDAFILVLADPAAGGQFTSVVAEGPLGAIVVALAALDAGSCVTEVAVFAVL